MIKNKKRGFAKIDKLISVAAKEKKFEQAFYQYKAKKNWDSVLRSFFEDSKGKTKVIGLRKGVLVVACLCKELAYQIKTLAKRIIYALNCILGVFLIKVIKLEI